MPIVPIEAIQPAIQAQQVIQIQELTPAPVADSSAVAKFQAAMAANAVAPASEIPAAEGVSTVKEPFMGTMGDAFKTAEMQNRQMYRNMESLIAAAGTNGGMTPADVMALQYQVQNLTFQQEVVTKVVDKVSNAIQTLVKNQ